MGRGHQLVRQPASALRALLRQRPADPRACLGGDLSQERADGAGARVHAAGGLSRCPIYPTPSAIRISRSAPLPSALSAAWYPSLSWAATAFSTLSNSMTTTRCISPDS